MDKQHNVNIGKIGEEEACKYLSKQGYEIIDRNFYTYKGEIDIIAKKNEQYVFVEVKTRMNKKYGRGFEAITPVKLKHFKLAVNYYIYKYKLFNKTIRLDAIEVFMRDKIEISHIKNITIWTIKLYFP